MKTGVFVVGALREIALCHRTWHLPADADVHLLTWNKTQDALADTLHPVDAQAVANQLSIKFTSVHSFDLSEYPYTPDQHLYTVNKGPWFWQRAFEMFGFRYDRIIILRPDIFLWPIVDNPWDVPLDCPVYTVRKCDDLFFVLNHEGFSFLSEIYDFVATISRQSFINVHDWIKAYYDEAQMPFNEDELPKRFVYFLARPASRKWADQPIHEGMINDVLQSTLDWRLERHQEYLKEQQHANSGRASLPNGN